MSAIDFKPGPKEWDTATEAYARLREPLTLPYGLDTLEALRLRHGERLLDLATGTGGVALAAARQGAKVVAVDWSPGMVGFLDARAKKEGCEDVSARVMDGQNLELPAAHFDAACSVFGIMFFPDHRAGLAELLRVLKPGGRLGITVWASPSRMGHLGVWEQAAHRICYPHAPQFARPSAWLQMDTPEGLRHEMEAVGFRDVSVTRIAHRWNVPSARWFIENFDASQVLSESPESRERIRESVLAQLDDEYGDGPFALTAHAHIGVATR